MTQTSRKPLNFTTYNDFDQQAVESSGIQFRPSDYDDKGMAWHNLFNSMLPPKEELPVVRGEVRVLDIGCNTGYSAKEYEKIYGYAEGIDSNKTLIDWSRYNFEKCHQMRMEKLEFKDESFSMVTAKDILEHSTDPMAALSEAYRVLADGGKLLALIPLDGDLGGIDDVCVHPSFNYNNRSHPWKATAEGVFRRLFDIGFTDIVFQTFSHSQMFGEKRELGDNVLVVNATKVKGIVKVPWHYLSTDAYWAAFLTFGCTGNCDYCIQHVCKDEFMQAKIDYERGRLDGGDWVSYYNNLQKWGGQRLGIIGGEPTLHPDFFMIVNGIQGYYKTVTTNLTSNVIEQFPTQIVDKANVRINTSFHPEIIDVDNFASRIHFLRDHGFNVDQIAMVHHPGVDFRKYHNEFLKRGITLTPQTYLGIRDGEMFPNDETTVAPNYGETGINNMDLYQAGFSCQQKQSMLCHSGRFLVAPDGGIYRCHYQLYSRRDKQGDVFGFQFPVDQDFRLCNDFGFCNPCDFPHVSFKAPQRPIEHLMMMLCGGDEQLAQNATSVVGDFVSKNVRDSEFFNTVFNVLYTSRNPWWTLYNNKEFHKAINEYMNEGGMADNRNLEFLIMFDQTILKPLPFGLNVYRILDDTALVKYLSYTADFQSQILVHHFPEIREVLDCEPRLLTPLISKMLCTFGTLLGYENFFYMPKQGEADEG